LTNWNTIDAVLSCVKVCDLRSVQIILMCPLLPTSEAICWTTGNTCWYGVGWKQD